MRFRIWDNGGMLKPRRFPFGKLTAPGWLVALWYGSSLLGNANRLTGAAMTVWDYLNARPAYLLSAGIAWIVLAMYWPGPKLWLYSLFGYQPKPKALPASERLDLVEGSLKNHATKQELNTAVDLLNQTSELRGKLHELNSKAIGRLEEDRTKAIEERADLGIRLSKLENFVVTELASLPKLVEATHERMEAATNLIIDHGRRLDEHRPWITELEQRGGLLQKKLGAVVSELPAFGSFMSDVSDLIWDADNLARCLFDISASLPGSEAATAPFSQRWLARDVSLKPDPLVLQWALSAERHVGKCHAFASLFSLANSAVLTDTLQLHIHGWNQTTSMNDSIRLVTNHRSRLIVLRQDYAAKLPERIETLVKLTTS